MTPSFALPLGALCLAFWPVWAWFAAGTVDGSNDSAGLLAAAAAIAIVLRAPPRAALRLPLLLPALCVALYLAACVIGVALSARALLAALALASLASASHLGKRLDVALAGLCVLALPLAATLQFYLGYPLRVVAGELSVLLLQMNGLAVVREGALLAWDGKLIAIDAPCSGIRMLWAGLFLACAMAAAVRLPAWRTLGALALATAVVVAANGVRASALFYSETGIVHLPAWTHAGMGVVCFVGAALAIVLGVRMLREGAR
jgi:exosortase/archaeosortase family protein